MVGVVRDVHQEGLEVPPKPEYYVSALQAGFPPTSLAIRTKVDPSNVVSAVRQSIWAVDHDQPITDIATMEQILDREVFQRRVQMTLLGAFAGLALLLAAIGLYGVLAYLVGQQIPEIGIRMALGAAPADVLQRVVGHGMTLARISAAGLPRRRSERRDREEPVAMRRQFGIEKAVGPGSIVGGDVGRHMARRPDAMHRINEKQIAIGFMHMPIVDKCVRIEPVVAAIEGTLARGRALRKAHDAGAAGIGDLERTVEVGIPSRNNREIEFPLQKGLAKIRQSRMTGCADDDTSAVGARHRDDPVDKATGGSKLEHPIENHGSYAGARGITP